MTDSNAEPQPSNRVLVPLALFAVYVIWGSTYLGIKVALDDFPPFVLNGSRLVVAGLLLYPIARRSGRARPDRGQWASSALVGGILFIGGLGFVTLAQEAGVGSGLVASAVAVMPLWAALWSGVFGRWPSRMEWLGLAVGFVGVVLLSREGDFQASTAGMVLMILSPMLWAFGSVISGRLRLPKGLMAASAQMITGGSLMLLIGLARAETVSAAPSLASWLAIAYLALFGSLFAYTAYAYLLATVRPALATSYAYVNPVVAVMLGVGFAGETIGIWGLIGLPVILGGVGIVGVAQRRLRAPRP